MDGYIWTFRQCYHLSASTAFSSSTKLCFTSTQVLPSLSLPPFNLEPDTLYHTCPFQVPGTAVLTSDQEESLCCLALLRALYGRESPRGLPRTLDQQVRWVDYPNYVEKHVVSPEIIGFWPRVLSSLTKEFQSARTKVQDVAIDLA